MRKRKSRHWHIDFLLNNDHADLIRVIASAVKQNNECRTNQAIMAIAGTSAAALGFGRRQTVNKGVKVI